MNGVNVNQENHKQVVARIKSIENETKLLGIVQNSDLNSHVCWLRLSYTTVRHILNKLISCGQNLWGIPQAAGGGGEEQPPLRRHLLQPSQWEWAGEERD